MLSRIKKMWLSHFWGVGDDLLNLVKKKPTFPAGYTEKTLLELLSSFSLEGTAGTEYGRELQNYLVHDYLRFVHTLNLLPDEQCKILEVGANPYFTSLLILLFTQHQLTCTNFFIGQAAAGREVMLSEQANKRFVFDFVNQNIEDESFHFEQQFDAVIFCEVIEHLTNDPLAALIRLKTILKPGGSLILSTPNVNRLENVTKMIAGENIYDPYSAYGPYGRHNREYNKHELSKLLKHAGFEIEIMYSADVHANYQGYDYRKVLPLLAFRYPDLGQYIFLRARNIGESSAKKPEWLYRSYPSAETST
jgi:SAM-dependent methyltransferase